MNALSQNMAIGQSFTIDTPLTNVLLTKQYSSNLSSNLNIGMNSFILPSFCQMLNQDNCSNTGIIIKVIFYKKDNLWAKNNHFFI